MHAGAAAAARRLPAGQLASWPAGRRCQRRRRAVAAGVWRRRPRDTTPRPPEDCAADRLDPLPTPAGLFAWTEPVKRSVRPTAPAVDAFATQAVESAVTASEARFGLSCVRAEADEPTAEALARWAQDLALDCIVTPRLPLGPTRKAVHAACSSQGLTLVEVTRPYDQAVWPHARAGFFGLKKKIPAILASLSLA